MRVMPSTHPARTSGRRKVLTRLGSLGLAAWIAMPALAAPRSTALAPMTDGPFYPPSRWRDRWPDWDADLTVVRRGGRELRAQGEWLDLQAQVVDTDGRALDNAEVEIWQCDALAQYRHPRVAEEGDPGFAGFGATRSDAQGRVRFRTIRPVPYPGRTPHIHVKLRHGSFGELTSQLFVKDDAGNARDFLWRAVPATERDALEMQLRPAEPGSGLRWQVRHALVVPA